MRSLREAPYWLSWKGLLSTLLGARLVRALKKASRRLDESTAASDFGLRIYSQNI